MTPPADRPPTRHNEDPDQRADRLWLELLQEVRVAETGVQILLGFLLTVAFTPRFADLNGFDRNIYITTVLLGAAATGALIAPVSLHRIVAGHRLKPEAVVWGSRFTVVGLILLLGTVASALLLILRVTASGTTAVVWVTVMVAWFAVCWFLPAAWLRHRERSDSNGPRGPEVTQGSERPS
ncbi:MULTISPECIES: DUF6328 family protein [unclassified Streptomyces]|uniref:DUF6328 family protein n=1 Tax=unclassified Streptomyces TaxID=2593676 RepID=UPI001EF23C29|nr:MULTISPECIES: DUF6328 family protein [unclassified Streptomyces]